MSVSAAGLAWPDWCPPVFLPRHCLGPCSVMRGGITPEFYNQEIQLTLIITDVSLIAMNQNILQRSYKYFKAEHPGLPTAGFLSHKKCIECKNTHSSQRR